MKSPNRRLDTNEQNEDYGIFPHPKWIGGSVGFPADAEGHSRF